MMLKINRQSLLCHKPEHMALFCTLFFITVFNISFWQRLSVWLSPLGFYEITVFFMVFLLIGAVLYLVFCLLLIPFLFKPVVISLILATSAISYFMMQYGVMIEKNMVRNAAQTDFLESLDLISWGMIVWLLLTALLPIVVIIKTKIQYRSLYREILVRSAFIFAACCTIAIVGFCYYQDFASLFRNHREIRFIVTPFNYLQATSSYLKEHFATPKALVLIGQDAKHFTRSNQPQVLVLVVGETARADHFSLNGYSRETNPKLSQAQDIINFSNMWSCGTETAVSIPCMFSGIPREKFELDIAAGQENVLDVLRHTKKIDVLWLDNNSGCKGVCERVAGEKLFETKPSATYCEGQECFDEVLVESLQQQLKKISRDTVIVLHQKGSHGPAYYKRYPKKFAVFQPECQTSELQKCTQAEITNSFDNTILYTDYVLDKIISLLNTQQNITTAMWYLSDHGESLGENNLYLHATPYVFAPDAQKHIPMLMWFSANWQQQNRVSLTCLGKQTARPYSHDNVFSTLLGLMEVQTQVYQRERDILARCQKDPFNV